MSAEAASDRIANVPTMYMNAIIAPETNTARGNVLRGLRTSSHMQETSSSPLNAKAICDQKFTVSQFQVGIMFATVKCVSDPCLIDSTAPITTRMLSGAYVAAPPAF